MTELSKGQALGPRFCLLSRLGDGGMAEVWLASDTQQDKPLVLKILHARLASQPEFVALLNAECERVRRLRHPNIVRVYGIHAEAEQHFISMEYIAGGTAKKLRGKSWQELVSVLLPVADALDYAHQAGLVHRDIRAANILLDEAGKPHLADFGIASATNDNAAEPSGEPYGLGGSMPSMSPQQLAGAQPSVSDDVYAFGALIYELVSGEPLFHPEVTAERIRNEIPPLLSACHPGIPADLDRLTAALLHKQPERRPVGMAAVRAALEAVLADAGAASANAEDDGSIRPIGRRQKNASAPDTFKPQPLRSVQADGGPGRIFYAGLGLLGLIVLGVVFVLPGMVAENQTRQTDATELPPLAAEPAKPDPLAVADPVGREIADAALADLLRASDSLRAQAVERWGGAEWFRAVNRVTEGDEFYKDRAFDDATMAYREALQILQPLADRVDEVLATALSDGATAIAAGNQKMALERFDLALAIAPGNLTAQTGRERALKLDLVMRLTAEASGFELASRWPEALSKYSAAVDADSRWPAALEGRERVAAIIAGNEYQSSMSAGYAALAEQRYADARHFFEAALRARAQDQGALQALNQIATEQRLARVARLGSEAESLAAQEDWEGAVKSYQAILSIDTSVVAARNGLVSSQRRAELDGRLRDAINSPDRLSDPATLQATRQLLDYARGIEAPGPVLTQQINTLGGTVQRAAMPVVVRFESDGLTEVVIYKVGRFEPFVTRDFELRPGVYTAVGARSGYRDVRVEFRVQPESSMQAVVIRCEVPI
jgi:tetratricopeptide (TPR) repeat protein